MVDFPASGAKAVERPQILGLVMAQDVVVAIVGLYAEVTCLGGIPLAIQLPHFEFTSPDNEAERPFVGTPPGITFDANFGHRASLGWTTIHRRKTGTLRLV